MKAVTRPSGQWTKHVHKLLHSLRAHGFIQAPEPLGFDAQGQEIVSFVAGETCDYPLSEDVAALQALISAAQLLQSYHDASQHFLNAHDVSHQEWMLPCREPQEVMCHSDFAPYNICFEGCQAVGIIDFDTIHPGPRTWDIAYALYRFAPFMNPNNEDGFGTLEDQILRARTFCNAYGLGEEDRIGLTDLMIERLSCLVDFLIDAAQQGQKKYELNLQQGHHLKYLADIDYITLHPSRIQEELNA